MISECHATLRTGNGGRISTGNTLILVHTNDCVIRIIASCRSDLNKFDHKMCDYDHALKRIQSMRRCRLHTTHPQQTLTRSPA